MKRDYNLICWDCEKELGVKQISDNEIDGYIKDRNGNIYVICEECWGKE